MKLKKKKINEEEMRKREGIFSACAPLAGTPPPESRSLLPFL